MKFCWFRPLPGEAAGSSVCRCSVLPLGVCRFSHKERLPNHTRKSIVLTNRLINTKTPMSTATPKFHLGSRRQPEESRAAILKAAAGEFSREGVAGARTDAIARAAHVNKALLYYYFKDKEALYAAVLDHIFGGLSACVLEVLSRDLPPREKIIAYIGAHFDYAAGHHLTSRIVQSEMLRAGRGKGRYVKGE